MQKNNFTDCWIFCTLRNFDNQSPKMEDTIFLYDHLANKFYEITII